MARFTHHKTQEIEEAKKNRGDDDSCPRLKSVSKELEGLDRAFSFGTIRKHRDEPTLDGFSIPAVARDDRHRNRCPEVIHDSQ